MEEKYSIEGMTCNSCAQKVQALLGGIRGVEKVEIDLVRGIAKIGAGQPVAFTELEAVLENTKYRISRLEEYSATEEKERSFISAYAPLLLVLVFITGVSALTSFENGRFTGMAFMNHFMAGFFLVFSFFKFLNLSAFAESYAMYDVLAKRIPAYGYVYPFLELLLGICFLTGFDPFITNMATVVLMGFSSIGVIQSVLNKKKIRCACLGAVFNLPMSTVTIAEDLLMVAMSLAMLVMI